MQWTKKKTSKQRTKKQTLVGQKNNGFEGSSSSGNPVAGGLRVGELAKLSIEQLKAVKEQMDLQVNLLQYSLNNISSASACLDVTSSALQNLSLLSWPENAHPSHCLLYVPDTHGNTDKVRVDVGTGYFNQVHLYPSLFINYL